MPPCSGARGFAELEGPVAGTARQPAASCPWRCHCYEDLAHASEHPLMLGGGERERRTPLATRAFPAELLVTSVSGFRKAVKVSQTSFITGPCDYTMSYKRIIIFCSNMT